MQEVAKRVLILAPEIGKDHNCCGHVYLLTEFLLKNVYFIIFFIFFLSPSTHFHCPFMTLPLRKKRDIHIELMTFFLMQHFVF